MADDKPTRDLLKAINALQTASARMSTEDFYALTKSFGEVSRTFYELSKALGNHRGATKTNAKWTIMGGHDNGGPRKKWTVRGGHDNGGPRVRWRISGIYEATPKGKK